MSCPTESKPTSLANDRLLDREEAAKVLGVKAQTLAVWAMTGRNLPVVHVGRRVKYRLSDIDQLVEWNTTPATA